MLCTRSPLQSSYPYGSEQLELLDHHTPPHDRYHALLPFQLELTNAGQHDEKKDKKGEGKGAAGANKSQKQSMHGADSGQQSMHASATESTKQKVGKTASRKPGAGAPNQSQKERRPSGDKATGLGREKDWMSGDVQANAAQMMTKHWVSMQKLRSHSIPTITKIEPEWFTLPKGRRRFLLIKDLLVIEHDKRTCGSDCPTTARIAIVE